MQMFMLTESYGAFDFIKIGDVARWHSSGIPRELSQMFENVLLTLLERLCINFCQSQSMGWNSRTEYRSREFLKLGNHPCHSHHSRGLERKALTLTHFQRSKRGIDSSYDGQGRETSVFNVVHPIFCLPNNLQNAAQVSLLWRLPGPSK